MIPTANIAPPTTSLMISFLLTPSSSSSFFSFMLALDVSFSKTIFTSGSIFFTMPSIFSFNSVRLTFGLISIVSFFETKSTAANSTPSKPLISFSILAAQFAQPSPSSITMLLFTLFFSASTILTSGSSLFTMDVTSPRILPNSFLSTASIVSFLDTKSTVALFTPSRLCV